MYLIRKGSKKVKVAHIWKGQDTECRMASTGGLNKSKYFVSPISFDLKLCAMCQHLPQFKATDPTLVIWDDEHVS